MDGKGKDASCDCYVKVKLAAKQYRTKPKMGELNPTFNNEFKFESRLDATGELLFELWDSDTHADDFIGRCSMPIAKVISEGKMEKNFDVYDNNMQTGFADSCGLLAAVVKVLPGRHCFLGAKEKNRK